MKAREKVRVGAACGKVILLGEHAVVYGAPALAVGIDRGARAEAEALDGEGASSLRVEGWDVEVSDADASGHSLAQALQDLLRATREAQHALGEDPVGRVRVTAATELPPGGGLGCSAALGVAIARALDRGGDDAEIGRRVMAWERVFHGTPSGIDAAVASSGGAVCFEKGRGIEPVLLGAPLYLCVGSTGVGSSTRSMVEGVRRFAARRPEIARRTWEGITALVSNARLALAAGDVEGLGKLMDLNQMLLAGLFVSTDEIERLCALARDAGALGAKLTGAGGGGSVIALVRDPEVAGRVLLAWEASGFASFFARVGSQAARAERGPEAPL